MPIFHYPFFYNHNYRPRYTNYTKRSTIGSYTSYSNNSTNNSQSGAEESKIIDSIPDNKKNNSNSNTDDYFFELFGLKLYFDDILLISLIFFLYKEGVQDDELFISLILLLLS